MSIQQNTALFSLLGTNFGGNGTTNFALPDLRSRVPVGVGQGGGLSTYSLGQAGGEENVTLVGSQMPVHTHLMMACATQADAESPSGNYIAQPYDPANGTTFSSFSTTNTNIAPLNQSTVQMAGNGQAHTNIQPMLALNYIICTSGLFPSRN